METIFILSFIVLCFCEMIIVDVEGKGKTWQMTLWRLLFVLSVLSSAISLVWVLTSEFDFHILKCIFPVFGAMLISFIGAAFLRLILSIIAWIFGTKADNYMDYLTGLH